MKTKRYTRPKGSVHPCSVRVAPDGKNYFIKKIDLKAGMASVIPAGYSGWAKDDPNGKPLRPRINSKRVPLDVVKTWRPWAEGAA